MDRLLTMVPMVRLQAWVSSLLSHDNYLFNLG